MNNKTDNCRPLLRILEAELQCLRFRAGKRTEYLQASFDRAIAECKSGGFLNLEALANERAAVALNRLEDYGTAAKFLAAAKDCNIEWGADAIVERLEVNTRIGYSL